MPGSEFSNSLEKGPVVKSRVVEKSMVRIRPAKPRDVDELLVLITEHARYERYEVDIAKLAPKLKRLLREKAPRAIILLAEVNNKLQGYCSLSREFSTWEGEDYLHMDCLFVTAEARGLKLGEALFQATKEYALEHQLSEIQWQTPEWNKGAARFYHRNGAASSTKLRFCYAVEQRDV